MYESIFSNNLENKKIIVRVDFNVPVVNSKISDHSRINYHVEFIKKLLTHKASVILISHFSRPKEYDEKYSLKPIFEFLKNDFQINFQPSVDFEYIRKSVNTLNSGECLLLENIRFFDGEINSDEQLSKNLASLADFYVNDAFSVSHRNHASTYGITKYLPSFAGENLISELIEINKILSNVKTPFTAIIGGSKISTKFKLLKSLSLKCDNLIIGGAMANTILFALGISIGNSLYETEYLDESLELTKLCKKNNCKLILPQDFHVEHNSENKFYTNEENFDGVIYDIGPKSIIEIEHIIKASSTIFWNGPLGMFEKMPFDNSSKKLCEFISNATFNGSVTIAGGGDTKACINQLAPISKFTYISNAGGAFLEHIQNIRFQSLENLAKYPL